MNRVVHLLIWPLLLLLSAAAFAGGEQASPAEEQFFPFSVWYSGGKARAPMLEEIDLSSRERWRGDLQQIKRLGFNTVRTWVEWTANEPRPGEYDFRNLELLAELAQETGLKVFVQVYTDSAPDWIGERWEDARFVAQDGSVITPQSAPGYCFDHPGVREKILEFYQAAARVASRFPNFIGWDLWSEPHVINWAIIDYIPNASFCYCPHSQSRFRRWLQQRYGTLEALNQAWHRTFTAWDQVEPPRFGTILTYTDFIDWRLFIRDKLARDLGARAGAVREVDSTHVLTSHAAVPALFTSPLWGVGAPDDWLMTRAVDYFGTSIYPKHSFPERHWSLLTLSSLMDFIRSSGKLRNGFYVGELQAGQGIRGTVAGDPVRQEDQRLWTWGMLSRGARAINVYAYYPMNSGYEAGGYGLVELDGSITPRAQALGQLASLVDRNQSLFLNLRQPKAEVAIAYNPLSYLVGGEQHLSRTGAVRESLQGIYRAFWHDNLPCDFVHLTETDDEALSQYKILFLPYPLMMTEAAARRLERFVEEGGTLVAEARCAWNDHKGHAQPIIPGFGLHEVFGVREGLLKTEEEVQIELTAASPSSTVSLRGVGLREELTVISEETRVLGRFENGRTAVTSRRHGRGQAVAVGTFLGMANAQEVHPATESFFRLLAEEAGVDRPVSLTGVPEDAFVEVRRLGGSGTQLLFLFNHSDEALTVGVSPGQAEDLETAQEVDLNRIPLDAGQVRVLKISGTG